MARLASLVCLVLLAGYASAQTYINQAATCGASCDGSQGPISIADSGFHPSSCPLHHHSLTVALWHLGDCRWHLHGIQFHLLQRPAHHHARADQVTLAHVRIEVQDQVQRYLIATAQASALI